MQRDTLAEIGSSLIRSFSSALLLALVLFIRSHGLDKDLWNGGMWMGLIFDMIFVWIALIMLTFPFQSKYDSKAGGANGPQDTLDPNAS